MTPLTRHGVKDSTTDEATIRAWFTTHADANVGIATGAPGPQVLDIDDPAAAPDELLGLISPSVTTGRGCHRYLAGSDTPTIPLGYGELRGTDSYVVAPPSIHPSGTAYVWAVEPNGTLPVVPEYVTAGRPRPGTGEQVVLDQVPPGEMYAYLTDVSIRLARGGMRDPVAIEAAMVATFNRGRIPGREYGGDERDTERLAQWAAQSAIAQDANPLPTDTAPAAATTDTEAPALTLRGVNWAKVKPIRWLWEGRIPMNMCSAFVGEEEVGKGTLFAWLAVQVMKGTLPGDYLGSEQRVLLIGDEDGFEQVWVPRMMAAGASKALIDDGLRTLGEGEYLEDLGAKLDPLKRSIAADNVGLVFFDQVLDNLSPGRGDWGATNIQGGLRAMTRPLRRLADENVAASSTIHANMGKHKSFRSLIPQQFGAVFRSALWVATDPQDPERRLIVRGKGNHGPVPNLLSYRLTGTHVTIEGEDHAPPLATDWREGEPLTANDFLGGGFADTGAGLPLLETQLLGLLTDDLQFQTDLAEAVGAKRTTAGDALRRLLCVTLKDGSTLNLAKREGRKKGWKRGDDWKPFNDLPVELCGYVGV